MFTLSPIVKLNSSTYASTFLQKHIQKEKWRPISKNSQSFTLILSQFSGHFPATQTPLSPKSLFLSHATILEPVSATAATVVLLGGEFATTTIKIKMRITATTTRLHYWSPTLKLPPARPSLFTPRLMATMLKFLSLRFFLHCFFVSYGFKFILG